MHRAIVAAGLGIHTVAVSNAETQLNDFKSLHTLLQPDRLKDSKRGDYRP